MVVAPGKNASVQLSPQAFATRGFPPPRIFPSGAPLLFVHLRAPLTDTEALPNARLTASMKNMPPLHTLRLRVKSSN